MSSSNEKIEISMKLIGARKVAEESERAGKGIKGVGKASNYTGTMSARAAKKTSLLTRAYGGLKTAAKYAFGAIAIGGGFALKSAIDKTAELSKTTSGLVRNFGFTTNVASRWAAVAESRGIDAKALSTGFAVLSSKMTEAARKGGTALTPFRQLGISQRELAKHSNDVEWGMMRVAKALGDAEGGAKRMTGMKGLLSKGWSTLGPLFSEGTKGLKEQLHWADKYGATLDTKTTSSIMGMVMAQRESKVAMLGLQLQAAKGLAPIITAANQEFQTFVATLNSNKLTGNQKITKIGEQFERLEDTLIQVITAALPKVAENAGTLGVKIAGAVVKGFLHASIWGKLVIATWIFKFLGGFGILKKVGARMAVGLGTVFLETLAPYFAAEAGVEGIGGALSSRMGGLRTLFAAKGAILGRVMGVAMAAGIGFFIGKLLAEHMNEIEESILGKHYGGISAAKAEEDSLLGRSNAELRQLGLNPAQIHAQRESEHWWKKHHPGDYHHRHTQGGGPSPRTASPRRRDAGGGNKTVVLQLNVDGRTLAQRVLNAAEAGAALA